MIAPSVLSWWGVILTNYVSWMALCSAALVLAEKNRPYTTQAYMASYLYFLKFSAWSAIYCKSASLQGEFEFLILLSFYVPLN